jgi:hypothetical protein
MVCFVKIVVKDPEKVCGPTWSLHGGVLSEHEVESVSLSFHATGGSVGDLSGFVSGELLTLVSDSVTTGAPGGCLGGGVVFVSISGLTSLEAERARGSFSLDNFRLDDLGLEEGLSNGVEGKGNALNENVESFEFNINGIVKVSDLKFSTPAVTLLVEVDSRVRGSVVIKDQSKNLHNKKNKNADYPDSHEDFSEPVEEGM